MPAAGDHAGATTAREALARWSELRTLYERLDAYVAAGIWAEAAALAPQLEDLARALGPAVAARRATETEAEAAQWAEVDIVAVSVIERHARVLRTAAAARDAVGAALARVHVTRSGAAHYRAVAPTASFFASRLV